MSERDVGWCVALIERIVSDWPNVRKQMYSPPSCNPEAARFFFGRGWDRAFVEVRSSFLEPLRLALRSNERSLPAYTGDHPSTNWWSIAVTDIDPHTLGPLVWRSYELCQLRNAGVLPSEPLKEAHLLLKAALKASNPSCWPPPPWHLGGPRPRCPMSHQGRIAAWCATLLAEVNIDAVDPKLHQRILNFKQDSLAADGGADGAADAVRLVARAYARETDKARWFLEELDRRILIGELEQQRSAHLKSGQTRPSAILEVLWRGTDQRGYLAGWLARLEHDAHGLLVKVGRQWTWTDGDRDSVLATVPDALFESAAGGLRGGAGGPIDGDRPIVGG